MKISSLIVAGFCGVLATSAAFAADNVLNGGTNTVKITDCSLLANDIKLTLSNNVVGSLTCNDTNRIAAIATCHPNGLVASRSAVVTKGTDGATTCTVVAGTEDCVETVEGSTFPSATTADGAVTAQFPGKTCSQGETAALTASLAVAVTDDDE